MGTDNQNSQDTAIQQEPRTFTQEEVNNFLAKDRRQMEEKYSDYDALKEKAARLDQIEEANKTELEKATERANALQAELDGIKETNKLNAMREKVAKEMSIPTNLLTGSSEEECREQAEAIKAYAYPSGYPSLKDGGEPQAMSKKNAYDDFSAWAKQVFV